MARQGFSRFKWSPSGYKAVQNGGAVQRILSQEAESRAGGANAALGESAYRAKQVQGKFAKGYIVSVALADKTHEFRDAEKRRQILKDQL